jgi:hypothetical protein
MPVPTLSEWGMTLAALFLLTFGTWRLAGGRARPTPTRGAAGGV